MIEYYHRFSYGCVLNSQFIGYIGAIGLTVYKFLKKKSFNYILERVMVCQWGFFTVLTSKRLSGVPHTKNTNCLHQRISKV